MLLTPGNAGSNTFADHREVLAAALQDGGIEEDKAVAEITHLMTRAENWPEGLRWIVRRVKPSRHQMKNLTDYEKKTGWRYSIICTNIPDADIGGRTAKALGLRALPSKTWHIPARLARHARQRTLAISPDWPWDRGLPHLLAPALRPAGTRLTSANHPSPQKGGPPPARSEPVRTRAHRGTPRTPRPEKNGHEAKNGSSHNQ